MADPTTHLSPRPGDEDSSSRKPELDHAEKEKSHQDHSCSSSSSSSVITPNGGRREDEPIVWHYLTFETSLPSPAHLSQPLPSSHDPSHPPPECPNLKNFTSPFLWPSSQKTFMTWLSCIATASSAYAAGSYAAAMPQLMQEWHISETVAAVGIAIFTYGFAIAPMVLAPFSEINGRRPVFIAAGLLFVVFQLICAVTPTFGGMLVARFGAGCTSSTFSTMVGGVVADIYQAQDRNKAMAMFSGAALFGTGAGPLVSGFLAQYSTWRWIFYLQIATCGTLMLVIVPFFKETRGSVLISRKAKILNKWYEQLETEGFYGFMMPLEGNPDKTAPQRIRWKVKSDEERSSIVQMIRISLYRPFHLLVTEPVVFWFSVWVSFAWGMLYLLIDAVPFVFETTYDFSLSQANAVFAATCVGAIISTVMSIYQEKLARKYSKRRAIFDTPEGRLYFCCVQSMLLPIGCFWFGWTSFPSVPWIVPALAVGCVTMGIFSIYLAVFNYLADTYHRYASSALAAQSCCRNMLGGSFPLFTQQMYRRLTYQGAGSLVGGLSAALTIVPWILMLYGPRIRKRSKLASEIMRDG